MIGDLQIIIDAKGRAYLIDVGAAMDAATVTQHDAWIVLMDAGNIKFYVIHIAGG